MTTPTPSDYSDVAAAQLDALEQSLDIDLFNAALDTVELIFRRTSEAHALSTAITSEQGICMVLPVIGHPPYKVFWSTGGPRIEAVFPYP